VALVVAASAWVVPEARSLLTEASDSRREASAVVSGAIIRVETVVGTPAQTLDRRSRPADRHRVLLPVVMSLPLLVALAVLWRRPAPIGRGTPARDRGRAVASRAPPRSTLLPALV
jgi:hypothetical protein